ncbi:TPA: LPXTG cell wall anchor domain-containing protein, partial [Listeria monocytogenes]|nr:LPXTG cell wall anchor domain-containing protein [Listeria monocytogenes]
STSISVSESISLSESEAPSLSESVSLSESESMSLSELESSSISESESISQSESESSTTGTNASEVDGANTNMDGSNRPLPSPAKDGNLAKTGDTSMLSLQGIGAGLLAYLSGLWLWARRKRKHKEVR